jgi:carboxypeptidase C (cathepsin A)
MTRIVQACAIVFALLFAPLAARGESDPTAASPLPVPKPQTVVTHHTARIGNRTLAYTATAGTIQLTNAKDEPTANVFYVAYTAGGAGPTVQRPITFAYNGGPGGSSALIHLGAFGPRTVVTTNAATTPPPPYAIVDNAQSLLDTSDLVFIDAVGTGFSRIVGHGTPKDFYSVDADGHAFEQFVRRYITANNRWNSPKYLAGESYGTMRCAVLAKMLQESGISLSGITLLSTVLNFATLEGAPGNDLPYWLYLPSEAAVAAYHHTLPHAPADLPGFLQTVRTFAQGPYLSALAKGANLTPDERDAVAQTLHADTGLPLDYLVRSRLRVDPARFEQQLLGSSEETIGRFDARFRNFDLDPLADSSTTDPSSDAVFGAFTAAFNSYVRSELHYQTDAPYALTANPYLRVFSANGIYDLATPFFATEYSLTHLGLNPALQGHITFGYYPSGHMIYLNPAAHAALKADLLKFYR